MKQLTYVKKGTLEWWDVPEPELNGPGEAIVRPFLASRCDGDSVFLNRDLTRKLRIGMGLHYVDPQLTQIFGTRPFAGPFAYGHECVAEVVEVGSEVIRFAVGDVVVVPWAVSCGHCSSCAAKRPSLCDETDPRSGVAGFGFGTGMGDWGGMVSDRFRVPFADALLVGLPEGADPLAFGAASDNMPDAWRTVAEPLRDNPDAPVLVMGGAARSIGLYAAGMAVALGSSRVDYADHDDERLRIAESLGANAIQTPAPGRGLRRNRYALSGSYPISVDASANKDSLNLALRALAPCGVCTSVGFYFYNKTGLPLWDMYAKGVTFRTGLSHPRADLPAVMELIATTDFEPQRVTTLVADWADAAEAFLTPTTKVMVQRARHSGTAHCA